MSGPVDAKADTGPAHANGSGRAVVSVQGLTKRYGDVLAVDGVPLTLASGTVTGFLGPNGAGKSTTLRMLLGLVEPTAGSALIDGRRYRA